MVNILTPHILHELTRTSLSAQSENLSWTDADYTLYTKAVCDL